MEVFQGYGQEHFKVQVLERLAMSQAWNETSKFVAVFCVPLEKSVDVVQRCQSLYDIARLYLTAPIDI